MMKKLLWFVPVPLALAGITLLLQTAAIGDVTRRLETEWSARTNAGEKNALIGLLDDYWDGPLMEIERACFYRDDAPNQNEVMLEVTGKKLLDADAAWAALQSAGNTVFGGRKLSDSAQYGPLSAPQRSVLSQLVSQLWSGGLAAAEKVCYRRAVHRLPNGQPIVLLVGKVWGYETLNRAEAMAILEAGEDIESVGVVQ